MTHCQLVSVVVPARNETSRLPACLEAVWTQKRSPFELEVIVVDNGSTDATAQIARSLGASVVVEAREGRSNARNAGMAAARGRIVVFLDADCIPQPGWLEKIMDAFKDKEVGCAAGEIVNELRDDPLSRFMIASGHLSQADNFRHPFLPYAGAGNVAFRKDVLDKIGGFDPRLPDGEDADLCWRMQLETGCKIRLVPEAVVFHRMEVTGRSVFRQKRRHAIGAVALYKKYRHLWKSPGKGTRKLYWEYRSLVRRALLLAWRRAGGRMGIRSEKLLLFDENQVVFELGWKLGLIEGSLRHRVIFL